MKRISNFLLVISLFSFCGCFFPFHKHSSANPSKKGPQLTSAKILSPKLLREAKTLIIVPFTAGENVEATKELDRLSLMIVKGFTLAFQEATPQIKILSSEEAAEADLVLKGHIIQWSKPERFKKVVMRRKEVLIKVDAQVEAPASGRSVLKIEHQRKGRLNQENEDAVAQKIGEDMAQYIAGQLNPENN